MLYDRHPESQSKWDKAFRARGYYMETVGNITDEAVQNYIKKQARNREKKIQEVPLYKRTIKNACDTAHWRGKIKPPVEMVVGDLG